MVKSNDESRWDKRDNELTRLQPQIEEAINKAKEITGQQ
jgi:hypothetical protein